MLKVWPILRRVGPVAAEGAGLGVPVRMAQHEPVARGLEPCALALDAVDEPVAALDAEDVAFGQLGLAAVRVRELVPEAVDVHQLVLDCHAGRLRAGAPVG